MKFNTKIIEFITSLNNEGVDWKSMFVETPFLEKDTELRKDNVSFEISQTEMEEYTKCSQDIIYFAENYCKIKREDGTIGNLKLKKYQIDILKNYEVHNRILHVKSRQIGITLINAIYLLHYCIFNVDKNILLVANLRLSCSELVDKIQNIYRKLPFFLKPGIKVWNQTGIKFSTGCNIKSISRSKEPAIGYSVDLLYIDEFAHIPSNIIENFYKTIVQNNISKIILSSTPNGKNFFYKLYKQEDSLYKIIESPYTVVEGRDEEWVSRTIKEIGGIEAFRQEFELYFGGDNKIEKTIEKLEERINQIETETYLNKETGDVTTYKIPSNNDLLERIIKIESNIDRILSKLNMISDYEKASKIELNPSKVTQEDVNLYKDRMMDHKFGYFLHNGTQSATKEELQFFNYYKEMLKYKYGTQSST